MKRVLLVTTLVLLAGCSAIPGPTTTVEPPPSDETTETQSSSAGSTTDVPTRTAPITTETTGVPTAEMPTDAISTATETATPTSETPTPEIDADPADNPWGKDTVTVAILEGNHDEIEYESALSEAIDYWNSNTQYGDYTVEFVEVGDVDRADIRVEIRESVDSCGVEKGDQVLGCAPLLTDGTRADTPVSVTIEAGYNSQSTEDIMIHEFGHVLGIRHGEDPQEYMQPAETVYRVAQPNATERAYPWETTEFTFFAETESLPESEQDDAREQVGQAIDYYNRTKDEDRDVPDNITVSWADNRSDANVIVTFPDDLPDGTDQGSSIEQFGFDPDGDGAIEYYTNATIALVDIDTAAVGWHTGYWFGQGLGINRSELPDPFQNADYDERRSDWWTESP